MSKRHFEPSGNMEQPNKAYLFVYGTLRKAYGLSLMHKLLDKCVCAGQGKVSGALYDLGDYPGAVEGRLTQELRGDVYEVLDAGFVFPLLDAYEGEEFCRKKTTVVLDSGEKMQAYIYWYTGRTGEALLIEENDYLDYLKNKKDRFE